MTDETKLQFVDTAILVYAHDVSAGDKYRLSKEIIQELWASGNGCLSIQVLQEFYMAVTRKVARPINRDTAARIIWDLSYWRLHIPDAEDVIGAIDLQQRFKISFWDAMILWGAKQLGCDKVWSEDLNPGQDYNGLQVVNPFLG